jgi:hypothetical protein
MKNNMMTSVSRIDDDAAQSCRIGTNRRLGGLLLAVALVFLHHHAVAKPGGTTILHFNFVTAMANTGVDANARGSVNGKLNRQGNANNQRLQISLANLDPNTTYQLAAFIGDDSNSTSVTEFTTDSNGAFTVTYVKKAQGRGNAGGQPLPEALNPLEDVRELDIVNGSADTVLRADLTDPDKLQYLVKRLMDNTGFVPAAAGSLQIKATATSTRFRLRASGLTPGTDYVLRINGNAAQTKTTDSGGNLDLKVLPGGSPNVLNIHALALTDTAGNLVLTAGDGSGGVGISTEDQARAAH